MSPPKSSASPRPRPGPPGPPAAGREFVGRHAAVAIAIERLQHGAGVADLRGIQRVVMVGVERREDGKPGPGPPRPPGHSWPLRLLPKESGCRQDSDRERGKGCVMGQS